jgi:membrane-bound lytic murein transglycosylase MltF
MRRRILSFLCLLVVAVLQSSALAADAPEASPFALPTHVASGVQGDFDELLKRRGLRILVVPNRTHFFVDRGVTQGITYDAFELFEKFLNKKHKTGKLLLKIAFIPVSRDKIVEALNEGRGDVAAADLTITPEREAVAEFSDPVMRNIAEILVTSPDAPPVGTTEELSGKAIFVRPSSSYFQSLTALNTALASAGKAPLDIRDAPEDLQDEDILEMLQAGLVQYTIVDQPKAQFWKGVFPNIHLVPNVAVRTGASIGWMVRKHSPLLRAELNDFLAKNPPGTSDRETLFRKYLTNVRYVKNATSAAELKKFEQVVGLFRKYAGQYDLDALLVLAQGYQESRLNQTTKSPVGAIGIMQLMPATGKELKVGDITRLEPNIHAGTKYLRFMINEYYKDEPIDDLNKALFTFASYNAGPAKVVQLRKAAATRGFDANRWFNNVEVIASERIGQETVRYVANIYKYYIAYKLVSQSLEQKARAKSQP